METLSKESAQRLGYQRLYYSERLDTCMNILNNWEPSKDALSLKYGFLLSTGLSALTPFPLFRAISKEYSLRRLKIGMGYTFRIIPVVLPSSAVLSLYHLNLQNILLESPHCSVCHEIRGVSSQLATGFALPLLLTFASKGYFLSMNGIPVPSPWSWEYLLWIKKLMRHSQRSLSIMLLTQIGAISLLVNHQIDSWAYIKGELNRRMEGKD